MIHIQEVSKNYEGASGQVSAVDSVSLTINKGEFSLIVGRSGSGKSTLLGIMGGLIKPTTGKIVLDGKDLWAMNDTDLSRIRGEKVGFVFQFSGLMSTLTALENVMLPSVFTGKKEEVEHRAKDLLAKLGVADKSDSYPSQLSGGEMKRVAIARALINEPEILLADEPTGDLDSATEIEIMELLKSISSSGVTIVMVTHTPELASYATTLYRMNRGSIGDFKGERRTGGIDEPQ
jgi:ABC-type lipoprotein export system ATPase subunit